LALEREGYQAPPHVIDAFVIPVTPSTKEDAFRIVAQLRREGVATEVDLMGRSLSKNFKHAASLNARKVIIVGEKELAQGAVAVRDMSSGDQRLVKKEDLRSEFK